MDKLEKFASDNGVSLSEAREDAYPEIPGNLPTIPVNQPSTISFPASPVSGCLPAVNHQPLMTTPGKRLSGEVLLAGDEKIS